MAIPPSGLPNSSQGNSLPNGVKDITRRFGNGYFENRKGLFDIEASEGFLNTDLYGHSNNQRNCEVNYTEAEFLKSLETTVSQRFSNQQASNKEETYSCGVNNHTYQQFDNVILGRSQTTAPSEMDSPETLPAGSYNSELTLQTLEQGENLGRDWFGNIAINKENQGLFEFSQGIHEEEQLRILFSTGKSANDNVVYIHQYAKEGNERRTFAVDLAKFDCGDINKLVSILAPPRA